jgi:hypothetical protein
MNIAWKVYTREAFAREFGRIALRYSLFPIGLWMFFMVFYWWFIPAFVSGEPMCIGLIFGLLFYCPVLIAIPVTLSVYRLMNPYVGMEYIMLKVPPLVLSDNGNSPYKVLKETMPRHAQHERYGISVIGRDRSYGFSMLITVAGEKIRLAMQSFEGDVLIAVDGNTGNGPVKKLVAKAVDEVALQYPGIEVARDSPLYPWN